MTGKQVRAPYTREFKLEAVRQVRSGQTIVVVAKVLGIPKSKHSLPIAPDLVQRRFNPQEPNQLWSGDITYIQTEEGWLSSSRH